MAESLPIIPDMPASLKKPAEKPGHTEVSNELLVEPVSLAQTDTMLDTISMPTSASELLLSELTDKTVQLRIAKLRNSELETHRGELEKRFAELEKRVASNTKRPREVAPVQVADVPVENPKKRPSPEPIENPKKRPSPEPAVAPVVPAVVYTVVDIGSDDDVPTAAMLVEPAALVQDPSRLFETLHSVLCAYKDKKIRPGSQDLPFDICADLCRDEADLANAWPLDAKVRLLPCILSALKLVYPNKKDEWFAKPFLSDAVATTTYWTRVLLRRAAIWDAAATRLKSQRKLTHRSSLKRRIKDKIAQRKAARLSSIDRSSSAGYVYKTPVKQTAFSLSSSDSDLDDGAVVDLSFSPPVVAVAGDGSVVKLASPVRLAPGPESYTRAEMKAFAKMAKAIRNVDEREGHAEATAAFVDTEFSDNTGRTVKCIKSRDSWKKARVSKICEKAARIMDDRFVASCTRTLLTLLPPN